MTYNGSCHCGAVTFTLDADIAGAMTCNCSRCHRLGWTLAFVPAGQFVLQTGADNLTEYRFNKKQIAHLFCKTCGIESFGRGQGPDGSETIAVNLRCLEGIDLKNLPTTEYDGKNA